MAGAKARKRGPTPPRRWEPMRRAEAVFRTPEALALRQQLGMPVDVEVWANDRYTVTVRRLWTAQWQEERWARLQTNMGLSVPWA